MKKYREYMDSVKAPDTLHQKLVELEAPAKPPIPWKRYGAMAAALALVVGLGGLGYAHYYNTVVNPRGQAFLDRTMDFDPEVAPVAKPDIAPVEPDDIAEPGMKTIGGYEVRGEDNGPDTVVSYYMLPYIAYGPPSDISVAASLAEPAGGLREATRDDVLALVGGEDALTAHLNWGGRELRGTVGFEADGTVWMLSLWGEGQDTAFSLELSPGRLPPTCCVVVGEQRTITNVWGVEVSGVNCRGAAYGDTERGIYMDVSREVEFIANGVGCRMKAYGTQDGAVEELVSRFVRWAVLEGLDLSAIGVTQTDGSYICHDCGQTVPAGTKHSHPHIGAGEDGGSYACPDCGVTVPAGEKHYHTQDGAHTCPICGEVLPIDVEHSHHAPDPAESWEISDGHPLAPEGWNGPSGSSNCEVCGQPLQEGVEHSHSEDHHGNYH